ncbi:hypothetical protein K439DRAFT_1620662 [Ramaria rubella]|nr:hypothetical protein K439DRAFT_1620662 [Ramaria rubella]
MNSFAPITAADYQIIRDGNKIIQSEILAPEYEFQHSDDFNRYRPGERDWNYVFIFGRRYAILRAELAMCIWESVCMKCRYIITAASGCSGNSDYTPTTNNLTMEKLAEINMYVPPIPPANYLDFNFFNIPTDRVILESWIHRWQQTAFQLSAWIQKAKENSYKIGETSWRFPIDDKTPQWWTKTSGLFSPCSVLSSPSVSPDASLGADLETLLKEKKYDYCKYKNIDCDIEDNLFSVSEVNALIYKINAEPHTSRKRSCSSAFSSESRNESSSM